MVSFKPITIEDREIITSYTLNSAYRNCDFSFANMCSWRFLYDSEYAIADGFLLIRFWIEGKSRLAYMFPVGNGNLTQAICTLEKESLAYGHPLLLLGISPEAKELAEKTFPGLFLYIPERDYFDYIYLRKDLAQLKGKKYQSKRNHINNFKKSYAYTYVPLTPEIIPQCLDLERQWYKNRTEEDSEQLRNERRSMTYALENYDRLGIIGGAICVDGKIVAFSYGAPINQDTFGVHVEKADINYEGSYALINQEFAAHIPDYFTYVNREEDLGIPGLRKAKLSYQPAILLEKNGAVKKPDNTCCDEKARNRGAVASMLRR
ncbi:MAG: phosphatidylglycerol lysyltransferase domain-containing protein [Massilibacteroides sp.]|nr:phosphatidylglycerol lysyltransferase domain-containing protein [Massilibacteroides sp.]MDD3062561.1 phosphatidylglycerol lysyltransferase domain-containing protein [Massilibacteroides sp.]MDD4115127.1 phosphatidylglycerol lysyltransferase domain-containing protein [Massilibacteroides sp.]MDD4659347.1 phosphatidylglycerol lysyltransferase domain-containing protein [Massilibacteroides sp.]